MGLFLIVGGFFGSTLGVSLFRLLQKTGQIDIVINIVYVLFLGSISIIMLIDGIKTLSTKKEGFTPANTNFGESSKYSLSLDTPVNTSSWHMQDLVVVPGEPLSKGVKEILNRPSQPVPLPEGQLLMFANTPFTPECCPNTYSNSMGCACMTTKQYNYLITRGGNNVPYSEY
jgi:hypothetical protein